MEKDGLYSIEYVLSEDVDLLRTWIRQVENSIATRERLSENAISQLQEGVIALEKSYDKINIWAAGYNPSIDRVKTDTRAQINMLKDKARNEGVGFWKDIIGAEKELRLLLSAYSKARWRKNLMEM